MEKAVIELYMNRIYKARMTAIHAKSQWAKDYWNEVANDLEKKLKVIDIYSRM
jgi:hypothetical protein